MAVAPYVTHKCPGHLLVKHDSDRTALRRFRGPIPGRDPLLLQDTLLLRVLQDPMGLLTRAPCSVPPRHRRHNGMHVPSAANGCPTVFQVSH